MESVLNCKPMMYMYFVFLETASLVLTIMIMVKLLILKMFGEKLKRELERSEEGLPQEGA